jgi:hypothetical protein
MAGRTGADATRGDRQERLAGWLSIFAGLVHGGLAPSHLSEWWGYGLFFVIAGLAQVLFGLALLTDAINAKDAGRNWWRLKRAFLWAGVGGNAFLILLYLVSRTTGIPWFGPQAGRVETVAPLDVLTKLFEAVLIVILVLRLREATPTAQG